MNFTNFPPNIFSVAGAHFEFICHVSSNLCQFLSLSLSFTILMHWPLEAPSDWLLCPLVMFQSFWRNSLFPDTKHYRFTLYLLCPPLIQNWPLLQGALIPLLKNGIRNHSLGTRCAYYCLGAIAYRPS